MSHLLDELLSGQPEDTEARVSQAKEEFNRLVRNLLIRETGLNIRGKRGLDQDDAEIPIRVKRGIPVPLRRALSELDKRAIEPIVSLHEAAIEELGRNAEEVNGLLDTLSKIDNSIPECDDTFRHALELSAKLSQMFRDNIGVVLG